PILPAEQAAPSEAQQQAPPHAEYHVVGLPGVMRQMRTEALEAQHPNARTLQKISGAAFNEYVELQQKH
ncbi:MAG TPA: hypothetical protein VK983_03120, partial [Candidatus Limnocylindrales bacterium]|nr:hypothetical protein [Candidatus Limnocylindrales bacterium]